MIIKWRTGTRPDVQCFAALFVKALISNSQGNCVEVRRTLVGVQVRDSKNPDGPVLDFTDGEWLAFLHGTGAGEFTLENLPRRSWERVTVTV